MAGQALPAIYAERREHGQDVAAEADAWSEVYSPATGAVYYNRVRACVRALQS